MKIMTRLKSALYHHRKPLKRLIALSRNLMPAPLERRFMQWMETLAFNLTPQHQSDTLPPIFMYWADRYIRPKFQQLGAQSPEDFYGIEILNIAQRKPDQVLRIISLGAGNGDLEIRLAQRLRDHGLRFSLTAVDLNRANIERGRANAIAAGLGEQMQFHAGDCLALLGWPPHDVVIVNQFLHHVDQLERFCELLDELTDADGVILSSDVIGRNGHLLWPGVAEEVQAFWQQLPADKTLDRGDGQLKQYYPEVDHAAYSNEGVRAQDIVAALLTRFEFDLFLTFGAVIIPFVERRFGFNFDIDAQADRDFIDAVAARDEALLASGIFPAANMFAVLCKPGRAQRRWQQPISAERHAELTRAEIAKLG